MHWDNQIDDLWKDCFGVSARSWIFIAVSRPCDVEISTLDASYPGGTTMHSDDNRCAIAKDFFQHEFGAASECELYANFITWNFIFGTVGANIDFMGAIFQSSSRVCDGWLLCGCLESVGTSWEWSWDIFWDLAWLPTVFAMVDGWSSLDYFMNISNKLMLLFWTFESSEDVIFIIICDLWHVYLVESTQ